MGCLRAHGAGNGGSEFERALQRRRPEDVCISYSVGRSSVRLGVCQSGVDGGGRGICPMWIRTSLSSQRLEIIASKETRDDSSVGGGAQVDEDGGRLAVPMESSEHAFAALITHLNVFSS